jgi:hypothetical protein
VKRAGKWGADRAGVYGPKWLHFLFTSKQTAMPDLGGNIALIWQNICPDWAAGRRISCVCPQARSKHFTTISTEFAHPRAARAGQ